MATAAAATKQAKQADLPLPPKGGIKFFGWITESWVFKNFILLCIIANAIALGVDAHFGDANPWHEYISQADNIFLAIFTVELFLEFLAQGPRRYFKDGWNWFDVVVVGVCYISAVPGISALRTLRVFRVLRLVSNIPQMRRVVEALLGAMPGIFATTAVLAVVFYIGAVMATTLFGQTHPEKFGDLGLSALTLFQLTLFDDWGATVKEMDQTYPWAWAFILIFTVLAAFAVLNLFIGVIVDAVQETRKAEIREDEQEIKEYIDEIREIKEDIDENVEELAEAQEDAAAVQKQILEELRSMRAELAQVKAERAGA